MRTTVEIPDEQYVALRTLAARRGLRGFSPLISEALELLLAREDDARVDEALALAGILDEAEAEQLERHVQRLRARPARTASAEGDDRVA